MKLHTFMDLRWVFLVASLLAVTALPGSAQAQPVFTVNSSADTGDANTLDSVCNDGTGACTLRAAIEQANALTGPATIHFNIPTSDPNYDPLTGAFTFRPSSAYPTISEPLVIDGTTQTGFSGTPLIEIEGDLAGSNVDGLAISAGSSTIRGLAINGFDRYGIRLLSGGGNTVAGNHIGLDVTGTIAKANESAGVRVESTANLIGGTSSTDRNIISANGSHGVHLGSVGGQNEVKGNYIGTDITGTIPLGNRSTSFTTSGVRITSISNNTVGGPEPGAGNLISDNDAGVTVLGITTSGNVIQGNLIGTNVTGTAGLGNWQFGVYVSAPSVLVGGDTAGAGNVISDNGRGIFVVGTDTASTVVLGNMIGVGVDDSTALGNASHGVDISTGASNTVVGGLGSGQSNVIAHNGGDGVKMDGSTTLGNSIRGNSIHSNTGLGINLLDGANDGIAAPIIDTGVSNSGTACPACIVDVYSDDGDQGRVYESSTVADGLGLWSVSVPLSGPSVTATATDAAGNTSRFATPAADLDGDGIRDHVDNCPAWFNPDQSLPPWPVPAEDPDCDGWGTPVEQYVGTDPYSACGGPNAWPPDITGNNIVNVLDVFAFSSYIGTQSGDSGYSPRYDLNANGAVNVVDVFALSPWLGRTCSP